MRNFYLPSIKMTGHLTMKILTPLKLGSLQLKHRIVMPPLTRMRANSEGIPSPFAATHYGQRSTEGGLIIAEATQISRQGQGYPQTPGIYTADQVAGWKPVVHAVRSRGGIFFLQLWHVGRISHSSFQENGLPPVAPSAIAPTGNAFTSTFGRAPYETPRALEHSEIQDIIDDYRKAAKNAKNAGFDGVEIHAANGYLLQQFLEDKSNQRSDGYGGPIENRAKLLFEVLDAITEVWPLDRIGVRLALFSDVGDMGDSNPFKLYNYVISELASRGISYLHLIEPQVRAGLTEEVNHDVPESVATMFRPHFTGTLIASGGLTPEAGEQLLNTGSADLIAFGRAFIATPDLVSRVKQHEEFNHPDRATFYGGGEKGYTDYPTLNELRNSRPSHHAEAAMAAN